MICNDMARVPGIGLLNRTYERRAERHGVQLLRGFSKIMWMKETKIEVQGTKFEMAV